METITVNSDFKIHATETTSDVQCSSNWLTRQYIALRVLGAIISICREQGLSPGQIFRTIQALRRKAIAVNGSVTANKIAQVGNRYFIRFVMPGYPSAAYRSVMEEEMNRIRNPEAANRLRILFLSITNKCALACQHCYEWPLLNQATDLNRENLSETIRTYQTYGVRQFYLSGGEPMVNFSRLLYLLNQADTSGADFWVFTSGYKLDKPRAMKLRQAGLTGLMISLDHHLPEEHDRFRGRVGSFSYAQKAVKHSKAADLVTCLSVCLRKDYCTDFNLNAYMDLARSWGVAFVMWLDPRATGRYAGMNITLSPAQKNMLDYWFVRYNTHPAYRDYPIIHYEDYCQRRIGCSGAGDRFLYINSRGRAQPCPFCEKETVITPGMDIRKLRGALQEAGCGCIASPLLQTHN